MFYLQSVLVEGGFDAFAEASCRPYYAARMGARCRPGAISGCTFFEGIDSERGLEWPSDSLSLRAFLRLGSRDRVPDHSWLSRSRTRLPHEVHAAVFDWVLVLIAEAGLIKGERIGVDASTMEANAALRNIVRRDNGEGYREMLERLARESGVETPTAENLARLDRKRKGKKLSNTDWVSKSDPEAKIAKMKDGTTHLAYKPEHAVDLDTGAVVAAELHPADEGDTTTLSKTLAKAMGRQKDGQGDLMVSWSEMPRSPGHVFYDRLQSVLVEGGFDAFAEASCRPYYAARMGAPSVPPGRYFRMHLVGYFEGIDSERGLEWRCSDSLSLRAFLRLGSRDRVPDHSWLSRSRTRLPHEVHAAVFDWVLVLIAEAGLIKGERIGVDASTMEANAALRNIVRRDNGEGYREMLERLARESGVETPTAENLARLDRKRKGKKLSNTDWVSKSDPEAKIAKMKDGTTHLAYKPEHAVDLDTGAVVAAELHPADEGDTTTLSKTLAKAEANLEAVDAAPTSEDPAECVADKGYHSRAVLRALNDSPWKTRIAAPKQTGFSRWHGDEAARRAVTNNRARLKSGVAREAFKLRAEIVERCFAHNLDRGGMRRTWLRGRENVHKRYLLHVAGHNLSLLMRQLIGAGTPREAVAGGYGGIFVLLTPTGAMLVARGVSQSGRTAFAAAFLIWE